MTAQSDRDGLELIRAMAGAETDAAQSFGRILADHLAEELPDIDPQTRARVALHIGTFIGQVSGRAGSEAGVLWGNTVLTAAVNQEES